MDQRNKDSADPPFPGTESDAPRRTRIQQKNRELILDAALEVFSQHGFRGATLDQIAEGAGLSKPNLLYYFPSKEDVHTALLTGLLDTWLDPLRAMNPMGDIVTPDDVAASIAFLASDDARMITGADLVIDGGRLIQ